MSTQSKTPDQRVAAAAMVVAARARAQDERSAATRVQQARSLDAPTHVDPTDTNVAAWVLVKPLNPQNTVNLDFGALQLRVGTILRDRPLVRDVMFALGGAAAAAEYLRPLSAAQLAEVDAPAITSMPFIGDASNFRLPDPPAPAPLTTEARLGVLEREVARLSRA